MGRRISAEKARHGQVQRHCHFSSQLLSLYTSLAIMYNWYGRASIDYGAYPKHNKT
jgi:hypothetical protein